MIRDNVTMERILQIYGYTTKKGFMCCPFHGEKEPSLKIYRETGGWHCFGCGKGGSVIDFVMEHENCNFQTAVRAINDALNLRLFNAHEHPDDARQEKRLQIYLDEFVAAVNAYCDALIMKIEHEQKTRLDMVHILEDKRHQDVRSVDADEWTCICSWKTDDEYDEYRKKRIEEFKEEVAAWRRKARRAK